MTPFGKENTELFNPHWQINPDFAGYADVMWWGPGGFHQENCHEMLSGEWAGVPCRVLSK